MSPSFPRRQALGLAAATALSWAAGPALAQDATPLKLVVTFPPGGSTDITARILQPRLAERLGRPVVVENRAGAASVVGTSYVAKSAPDGNTVLVSFDSHAINPIAKPRLPYDTFKDFSGASLAVRFPLVIAASASVKAANLKEFLAQAKGEPARYSYASTGVGSMNQLVMEDIKRQAGVYVLHVPYGGGGPAVQAVLADQVQLTLLSYAALKGQISAGKIKPLAVTGAKRLADLPNVPTVAESGFPGFEAYSWIGLFVPSATPPATLRKLSDDMRAALNHAEVHDRLTAAGFEVMASDGPALDRYAREQHDRWADFIAKTKLKIDD
ncbi:MAG: tripartite tricarboxylate transporter substrate binding protein [Burkholderiaceae bacterium]|nr:tripartite tricarboxylate transporter substrate binding protein [Burkholderiaceae bacterium]